MKSIAEKSTTILKNIVAAKNEAERAMYVGEALGMIGARLDSIFLYMKYHAYHRMEGYKPCSGCKYFFWGKSGIETLVKIETCYKCENQEFIKTDQGEK